MENTFVIISSLTALFAVILAPLVSIYVSGRQARLQAIVLERRDSTKEIRRVFSELVSILSLANNERGVGRLNHKDSLAKFERVFFLETELSLMLTAESKDRVQVLENITEGRNRVFRDSDEAFDPTKWEPHYFQASFAMIRILKEERSKVRNLE